MKTDGPGVGQASEKVGAGSTLRSFILQRVFDGNAEFGASREQHAEMVFGEEILLAMIQGQDSSDAIAATKGNTERGQKTGCAWASPEMKSFRRGVDRKSVV